MNRRNRARAWETLARVHEVEGLALRAQEDAERREAADIQARIRDLLPRADPVAVGRTVPVETLATASVEAELRRRQLHEAEATLRQVRAEARQLEERAREASRGALTFRRLRKRS